MGNLKRHGCYEINDHDWRDGSCWIDVRTRHNNRVVLKIDPRSGRILDQRRR